MRMPAVLALLVLAAACRHAEDELPPPMKAQGRATPHRGGVLHFALGDDVRTLDPAIAYDEYSFEAERLVFDGLVAYAPATSDDPLRIVPQLAESWSVSPDGRTYSFTLREGAQYDDGQPIEADDFVFALERVLDPATGSPGSQFFQGIVGAAQRDADGHVAGLRALDARHLEIRLAEPDPSFLMVAAMPFCAPLKREWAKRTGERIRDTPLCSGPFRLASWRQGAKMIFERNPRYWDAASILLDGVVIDLLGDPDTNSLRLLRGELDAADRLSSDKYVRFKRSDAWRPNLIERPTMTVYGELMDVTKPPFDDRRVRQAMNYAFDKEDTVVLNNGRAIVAHGLYPPGIMGYDPGLKPYPHDPAKARELLREAGYPDGFDVTYTTVRTELSQKVAESLQSDLAEVGIRVKIQIVTFPAYLTAVGRHELPFAYTAWVMDFPDPWDFIEVKFHSRSISEQNSNNDTGYSNPELDRLLDRARRELDPETRADMYRRAERILYDDCPWIWHYHVVWAEVVQPYVKNYDYHPVYQRDFRYAWLDKPEGAP